MRRLFLTLLVLLGISQATGTPAAAAAATPAVFQLDVCNKHRTVSEAPGTSLTITKDGMCIVTSQLLTVPTAAEARSSSITAVAAAPACKASKASTAVLLRFPCKEQPRLKEASGPALNLWGSFEDISREGTPREGMPRPSSSSSSSANKGAAAIITEAAPKQQQQQRHSIHAANKVLRAAANASIATTASNATTAATAAAAATTQARSTPGCSITTTSSSSSPSSSNSSSSSSSTCSFLTLNPGLYYHKSPPLLTYGYVVGGVACDTAASAKLVTAELDRSGARTFPTTYGLWLKPSLPAPPASMSSEQQSCNLVLTVLTRSYVSTDTYPCSMRVMAPEELQDGCCYNAGGMGKRRRRSLLGLLGQWPHGRELLSSWEKAVWTRRALQL